MRAAAQMAVRYQEAADAGAPFGFDIMEDEDEEDAPEDDGIFNAEHFYFFKRYFTKEEAKTFLAGATDACENALESMFSLEDGDEDDDDDDDDDDIDDDDDDEDDFMNPDTPWKDE